MAKNVGSSFSSYLSLVINRISLGFVFLVGQNKQTEDVATGERHFSCISSHFVDTHWRSSNQWMFENVTLKKITIEFSKLPI